MNTANSFTTPAVDIDHFTEIEIVTCPSVNKTETNANNYKFLFKKQLK